MSTLKTRIAFIHVPKTAGSFFTKNLKMNYTENEICPNKFIGDFSCFYENPPLNYCLYTGHMGFAHTKKLNANVITFLRNPIDRLISLYFFFQETFDPNAFSKAIAMLANGDSELFACKEKNNEIIHSQNSVTWHLAFDPTIETRINMRDLSEDDLYNEAVINLNACSFIGIVEFMNLSINVFYKKFPQYTNKFTLQKENVTAKRLQLTDIPIKDRRILLKLCEIDCAVYDYAIKKFSSSLEFLL
jgi:hypothetical protein